MEAVVLAVTTPVCDWAVFSIQKVSTKARYAFYGENRSKYPAVIVIFIWLMYGEF